MQKTAQGTATWFLIIVLLISLLFNIAITAQNIRLRLLLKQLEDQVTQTTDQSAELDSLHNQVDALKKQKQDISKDLENSKSELKSLQTQLDKSNQQLQSAKKVPPTKTSTRKRK